jgi:hypothetical protein
MSLRYARDINKQKASYSDRWGVWTFCWTVWFAAASKSAAHNIQHVALCATQCPVIGATDTYIYYCMCLSFRQQDYSTLCCSSLTSG